MAEDSKPTLQLIAQHLIAAAQPLIEAGSSLGAFMRLMARIGFFASDIPQVYRQLATTVGDAASAVENLPASPSLQDVLALLQKAKAIFDAIQQLAQAPAPAGVDASAYATEIGERLFELLLTDYLALEQPGAYNVLSMLRVITVEPVAATATRPSYIRTRFRWDEIPKAISDPAGLPARVYGWGQPDFDAQLALEHLGRLGLALGLPVAYRTSDDDRTSGYLGLPRAFPPRSSRAVVLPFFYANIDGETIEGALALQRLPAKGTALPGLVLEPRLPAGMPFTFQLSPSAKITLRAGTNLGELFGLTLRPPREIGVVYPFAPDTPPPAAGVGIQFSYTPPETLQLLGDPKASRIELGSASVDFGVDVSGSSVALNLGADLQGLKVVIAAGEGDGFLRTILGDTPVAIDVPLGFEWSQNNGLRFKGSAAFEVALHPHLHLGPIKVDEASLKLAAAPDDSSKITLDLGASLSGSLGPIQFALQGVGLTAALSLQPGNAGPFGIDIGFKSPTGVGLAIDAGGFVGGGFLNFDSAKGEYSGALELTFQNTISIRAIGILSTKTGSGSGFSLLILVVTEFTPIQLSFGFTLLGVGGLLGLNRSVVLDQLQLGVRDGSLDSVLFPRDVVANAPRILGDLQRIFPTQDGLFLIGPMAKLGWGTPTLVSLELGLILDLPRPMFAIVGILRVAAPTEELPVLRLTVSFAGSVDFEKGQLQFDASLFDSRVLNFTLTGDMAVRVYWKEDANLLLTVGGFNPAYTPPPMNLGTIRRLGIVLFEGNPDVRVEAYFAITSNTVQFGGKLEVKYGLDIFNVYGFIGLDVLISRNPFHFVAEITGQLAVRTGSHVLFSMKLDFILEGPKPLHAHGKGSFEIGFIFTITFSVSFDITIGDPLALLLSAVDVLGELVGALSNLGNWRPILPPGSNQSVSLRKIADDPQTLVLHPFGTLSISQKSSPLNIAIQRFGSSTPDKGSTFQIIDVKIGSDAVATSTTSEEFAPAQFFTMSDAEKLSRPSFSAYDSGINIGGDLNAVTDAMRSRDVTYEVIYLLEHAPTRVRYQFSKTFSKFALGASAASKSALSQSLNAASALSERVTYSDEHYAVASTDDLTLHAPGLVFANATAADQALRQMLAQQPELHGSLQVLPASALAS
ncbi:MAG TPA: DUF6603 domain-containing protein [Opitutaceae bacterium]|nr:DUF6603 domain-containing protein [Opitutaceae bacterium]